MKKKVSVRSLKSAVDRLGKVKALKANLAKQEATLRQQIVDSGLEEIDGELFRATVSESETAVVDFKSLFEHLKIKAGTLAKFTTSVPKTSVRVVARKS